MAIKGERMLRTTVLNNLNLDGQTQRNATTVRRGHGRGIALGLSLPEVLIFVLFLLLLVLVARLVQVEGQAHYARTAYDGLQASVPALKPLLESLRQEQQLHTSDPQELAAKLARAVELAKVAEKLSLENSDLRLQLAALTPARSESKQETPEVSEIMARAGKIFPDDPPAALEQALAVLERFGPNVDSSLLSAARLDQDLKGKVASFETVHDVRGQYEDLNAHDSAFPPKKIRAHRVARSDKLRVTVSKIRGRLGCEVNSVLHSRMDRPARAVSAWCS
jgi:hypothetical protein